MQSDKSKDESQKPAAASHLKCVEHISTMRDAISFVSRPLRVIAEIAALVTNRLIGNRK